MKTCSKCDISKDESEFYSDGKGGLKYCCKECDRKMAKQRYKPVTPKKHTCKQCGEEFKSTHRPKFCSDKCKNKHYYNKYANRTYEITCKGCNEEKQVTDPRAEYCSHKCYYEHGDHSMKGTYEIEVICDTCEEMFMAESNQSKYCSEECNPSNWERSFVCFSECVTCQEVFATQSATQRYCSDECYEKASKQRKIEHWLSQPERECRQCGSKFQPQYKKLKNYCSTNCKEEYNRQARRSNESHYARARKFGVAREKIVPTKVFKRDNYTCQCCGIKTDKSLVKENSNLDNEPTLDHIIPMSKGGPHTYGNVQTMCRKCNTMKGDTVIGQQPIQFEEGIPAIP